MTEECSENSACTYRLGVYITDPEDVVAFEKNMSNQSATDDTVDIVRELAKYFPRIS